MVAAMTKKLEILERSLAKKERAFDCSIEAHFTDVKRANGQPMNDKRNGQVTLNRWEKQSSSLRRKQDGIEKTKRAIEREREKISETATALNEMPFQIVELLDSGVITQWRKHPNTFFVNGVDKARISYKGGVISHKYANAITCKSQWALFRDTFNGLSASLRCTP